MILCLETTSHNCSVALSNEGHLFDVIEERGTGYSHAEKLHVFIDEILKRNGLKPLDLTAVAVSGGPGSYTGLRIGVSTAKGLCFALGIPLISLDTLHVMALNVMKEHHADIYMPMIDARRMEVYVSSVLPNGTISEKAKAVVIDSSFFQIEKEKVVIFGEGAEKLADLLPPNYELLRDRFPSATLMAEIAASEFGSKNFADIAYYEPFYLKDFVAGVSTKSLL